MLRTLRTARQMNQIDASSACGLNRTYLGKVESGAEYPKLSTLIEIRDGLALDGREWNSLLARYLIENGAVKEGSGEATIAKAVGKLSRDEVRMAAIINETSDAMLEMTARERAVFAGLPALFKRNPDMVGALEAILRAS